MLGFSLLLSGGEEEEAFWFFVSLAKSSDFLLMGFYQP